MPGKREPRSHPVFHPIGIKAIKVLKWEQIIRCHGAKHKRKILTLPRAGDNILSFLEPLSRGEPKDKPAGD